MVALAVVIFAIPLFYGFLGDDLQDLLDVDLMQFAAALIATAGYIAADPNNRKARAIMFLLSFWCWWVAATDSFLPWVPPGLSAVESVMALVGLWWIVRRDEG